jgi:hypothetical protein
VFGSWSIQLGDSPHAVLAELSPWTGKLEVHFDGELRLQKQVWWMMGEIAHFESGGHQLSIRVRGFGYLGGRLTLWLDGHEVHPGGPPVPAKPRPQLQVLREVNVAEKSEIVEVQEFPLDNRSGTDVLTLEQELVKTVQHEFSVQSTSTLGGQASLDVLSALKAEVSAQLSKQIGQTLGETVTRRQTLRFTVKPSSTVVYVVTWRSRVRTGEFIATVEGNPVSVPYRVFCDLACEIRSREGSAV